MPALNYLTILREHPIWGFRVSVPAWLEETRRVAQNHLIRLHGLLGELAVAQGWVTKQELEQVADALMAW